MPRPHFHFTVESSRLPSAVFCRFRNNIAELLSEIIFNYIVCGSVCICTLLYQFQIVSIAFNNLISFRIRAKFNELTQSAENISIQLYQSAGLLCVTMVFMFILSLIGHLVTEKSFSIGESVYASQWYILPLKYRVYVPLMIQHSHRPFHLSAWGFMDCNLENFVVVSVYIAGDVEVNGYIWDHGP